MKTFLQIAAGLSFLFPFLVGAGLFVMALSSPTTQDFWIPAALGAFLIGNGIFVGAILLFAAVKVNRNAGSN